MFNEKWITELNPVGIRIGYKDDVSGWVTAQYSLYKDTYLTKESVNNKIDEPTHFYNIFIP